MLEFLYYVALEFVRISLWSVAVFLMLGGVFSYVIKTLTNSGKELINVYFARKEQYLHNIGGWPGSGSKNVN